MAPSFGFLTAMNDELCVVSFGSDTTKFLGKGWSSNTYRVYGKNQTRATYALSPGVYD